jgi:DNA-binding transcriptional LysR family regulator
MSSTDIDAGLEDLSLDLALGYSERLQSTPLKARAAQLATLLQYEERYFLLRRAAKPSAKGLQMGKQPCTWAKAADKPLCLLTPEMYNRFLVDGAFSQAGVQAQPVIETDSVLTLGLTVLVGDVCSVLPGALLDGVADHGELEAVPLQSPTLTTPIAFMYANTQRPSHTLKAALELAADPEWMAHVRAHAGARQA